MINTLNKTGLIEAGYKRIGNIDGKSVYKRLVPEFSIDSGMSFYHNGTRNRQITEFAYLDDATDKVVKTATRRVGEYGESAKSADRSTKTEFTKSIIKDFYKYVIFKHFTDSQPVHKCVVNGNLPGTFHVAQHKLPNPFSAIEREVDFVTFNTNGEILQRGRVRTPKLPEDTENGLQEVWIYNRGIGYKPGQIQSSYTSHIIEPDGNYVKSIKGSGPIYTPESQVGIPKYTSFSDLKSDNEFFTKEFNG